MNIRVGKQAVVLTMLDLDWSPADAAAELLRGRSDLQTPGPVGRIRLENAALSVDIDETDGAIVSVRNKRAGLELITRLGADRQPWLLLLDGNEFVSHSRQFQAVRRREPGRQAVELQWTTDYGITVRVKLALADDADQVEMRCEARNGGSRTIVALNYPRLAGIGPLGTDGAVNHLLHPSLGGALVRDPFRLFNADSSIPQGRGFLPSRYPNGFAGAPLQMTAYYVDGVGGFYLATEDSLCTDKDFNFFKTGSAEQLAWEVAHFQWDARQGRDLSPDYPVVLAAMTEGSWYEAAQRYRKWATVQRWCARGTRWERVQRGDASRWLLEEIGAISMWWPFEMDIREPVRRAREVFGAPLLHFPLRWTDEASVREAPPPGIDWVRSTSRSWPSKTVRRTSSIPATCCSHALRRSCRSGWRCAPLNLGGAALPRSPPRTWRDRDRSGTTTCGSTLIRPAALPTHSTSMWGLAPACPVTACRPITSMTREWAVASRMRISRLSRACKRLRAACEATTSRSAPSASASPMCRVSIPRTFAPRGSICRWKRCPTHGS